MGTAGDNARDADKKGRLYKGGASVPSRGEKHYKAKLTEAQVAEIRELSCAGVMNKELAERYRVSRSRISMISHFRSRANG